MGKKLNKFAKQMLDAGMPMKAVSELTDLYLDQNFTGVIEIKIKTDSYPDRPCRGKVKEQVVD